MRGKGRGGGGKGHEPPPHYLDEVYAYALGIERIYLLQRCFDASKPRVAAATGAQYGFSRRNKIPRCSAQKLISSSMSRHLSTRNISSKSMHAFLSNLAQRQTDRQTNERGRAGKNIYLLRCRR